MSKILSNLEVWTKVKLLIKKNVYWLSVNCDPCPTCCYFTVCHGTQDWRFYLGWEYSCLEERLANNELKRGYLLSNVHTDRNTCGLKDLLEPFKQRKCHNVKVRSQSNAFLRPKFNKVNTNSCSCWKNLGGENP